MPSPAWRKTQAQPQPPSPPDSQTSVEASATPPPVTLPAGTRIALVLTHHIQSRSHPSRRRHLCPDHFSGQLRQPDGDSTRHICARHGREARTKRRTRGTSSSIHVDHLSRRLRGSDLRAGNPGKRRGLRTERSGSRADDRLRGSAGSRSGPGRTDRTSVGQFAEQHPYQLASARLHRTAARMYFVEPKRPAQQGKKHSHWRRPSAARSVSWRRCCCSPVPTIFSSTLDRPLKWCCSNPLSLQQSEVRRRSPQSPSSIPWQLQPIAGRPVAPQPPTTRRRPRNLLHPGHAGNTATRDPRTPGPDGVPGPSTTIPGTPPIPGTPYPCP